MLTGLLHAHSGLRYLVLLAGALALGYALFGLLGKRPYDRVMKILGASFAGLLHLQVLLGFALIVTGLFYPALIGHVVLMLAAAVVAQLPLSIFKRRPPEERSYLPHAAAIAVAFLLMWGGVAAIGRGLLEAAVF